MREHKLGLKRTSDSPMGEQCPTISRGPVVSFRPRLTPRIQVMCLSVLPRKLCDLRKYSRGLTCFLVQRALIVLIRCAFTKLVKVFCITFTPTLEFLLASMRSQKPNYLQWYWTGLYRGSWVLILRLRHSSFAILTQGHEAGLSRWERSFVTASTWHLTHSLLAAQRCFSGVPEIIFSGLSCFILGETELDPRINPFLFTVVIWSCICISDKNVACVR